MIDIQRSIRTINGADVAVSLDDNGRITLGLGPEAVTLELQESAWLWHVIAKLSCQAAMNDTYEHTTSANVAHMASRIDEYAKVLADIESSGMVHVTHR